MPVMDVVYHIFELAHRQRQQFWCCSKHKVIKL